MSTSCLLFSSFTHQISFPLHCSMPSQSLSPVLLTQFVVKPPNLASSRLVAAPSAAARGSTPEEALSEAERALLEAISDLDDGETVLPCVRAYENDSARLTVVGAVDYDQALTAAAADRGEAAAEHVASGMDAMVVETVFPGESDEHSTVSTKLFLPARKVKEKARRLRGYITEEMLRGTDSRNVLTMTFRQVVMQRLWNFELVGLVPGSARNMNDLASIREGPFAFTLCSSDEKSIYTLAEAVCILALESTEKNPINTSSGNPSIGLMNWISRTKRVESKDSSVVIYQYEDEIVNNAKLLLERYNSEKGNYESMKRRPKNLWWKQTMHSKLERLGGPHFSCWTVEYIPAYKLEIDASRLKDLKIVGWERAAGDRWQVVLTHSQMLGLAGALDMFLEDLHTLPGRQLSCGVIENPKRLSKTERGSSLLRILSTMLASAILLVSVTVMGQLGFSQIFSTRAPGKSEIVQASSEIEDSHYLVLERSKMEASCSTVIRKIKGAYGWEGDIKSEPEIGAWIGDPPVYLLKVGAKPDVYSEETFSCPELSGKGEGELESSAHNIATALPGKNEAELKSSVQNMTTAMPEITEEEGKSSVQSIAATALLGKSEEELKSCSQIIATAPSGKVEEELNSSAQNIASYQVVLSVEGRIVGFQPTSRLAVNHWASNPLAKELYGGKKLLPGLLEPRLKVTRPGELIVLQLLISVNQERHFALARPLL